MKFKGLKTIAAVTAVSAGVLFAGANSANASTRVTVKSGDTISELAKTYNISMQSIKDANNIQDINKIYVGEVFDIDNGDVQVVAPATTDTPAAATPSVTAPVQQATAPAAQAPAQPAAPVQQAAAPATSSVSGSDAAAKDWIAGRESGGNYGAQNGQFVGKYQLSASYLNGDYSAANQERVADNYVTSRYGSWSGAQSFWQSHGWY
ncbi:LysM peptidoglycan-binding domain-containing protein [Fructilactobacillus sanfranciscensis]|uniref:aggregation-promoting factor n=1 Tax=Fructilactobacillus sanfranciscensis TaxID=1625 RepID=UPI0037577D33